MPLSPQEMVDRYVVLCAREKAIKERRTKLRTYLVKYLRTHECPSKGPFILEHTQVPRTLFCWELFARKVAKLLWAAGAKSRIKKEKIAAGVQLVDKLTPKPNPRWRN